MSHRRNVSALWDEPVPSATGDSNAQHGPRGSPRPTNAASAAYRLLCEDGNARAIQPYWRLCLMGVAACTLLTAALAACVALGMLGSWGQAAPNFSWIFGTTTTTTTTHTTMTTVTGTSTTATMTSTTTQTLTSTVTSTVTQTWTVTTTRTTITTSTTTRALLGEYGAVTVFDIPEWEARLRVRRMTQVFQIREFQFYDMMEGYSHPPSAELEQWRTACLNRKVQKKVIQAYLDEIRRLNGRAWLYVQSMATDLGDKTWQQGFKVLGEHFCYNRPVIERMALSGPWGRHIAPQWAAFAKGLGFHGIHWDTLGADGNLPAFLDATAPILRTSGMLQTCNFVDGAGWRDRLLANGVVQFPYWELWNVPLVEDMFFRKLPSWGTGVFASYPGQDTKHIGEPQNKNEKGVFPMDIIVKRWKKGRLHGASYLVISDGLNHIQTAYFPSTVGVSWQDIRKIREAAFGQPEVMIDGCSCNCRDPSWQHGKCDRDNGNCCIPVCCTKRSNLPSTSTGTSSTSTTQTTISQKPSAPGEAWTTPTRDAAAAMMAAIGAASPSGSSGSSKIGSSIGNSRSNSSTTSPRQSHPPFPGVFAGPKPAGALANIGAASPVGTFSPFAASAAGPTISNVGTAPSIKAKPAGTAAAGKFVGAPGIGAGIGGGGAAATAAAGIGLASPSAAALPPPAATGAANAQALSSRTAALAPSPLIST